MAGRKRRVSRGCSVVVVVTRMVKSPALGLAILALSSAPAAAQTFTFSGSEQTYTVPAGITKLDVSMSGGDGGAANPNGVTAQAPGGHGGTVSAVLAVSPGEVLYVEVGGAGNSAAAVGGWNGGGAPSVNPDPDAQATPPSGSGGGATDVRTVSCGSACPGSTASLESRLLVAGGGGGGGFDLNGQVDINGSNADSGTDPTAVTGINGGTAGTSAPGAGGAGCDDFAGNGGGSGSFGAGGNGGLGAADFGGQVVATSSGGGGGGYQGGGGGGGCVTAADYQGGAGGGGSDFASSAATSVSFGADGTAAANGSVSITPAVPGLQTAPRITGTATVGQTLTVVPGQYNNTPTKFTYQWYSCSASNCSPIPGATGTAWPLTPSDVGATLKVQETASNAFGTGTPVMSGPTPVISQPATTPGAATNPAPQPQPQPAAPSQAPAPATATQLQLGSVTVAGPRATVHLSCPDTTREGCQGAIMFQAAVRRTITIRKDAASSKTPQAGSHGVAKVIVGKGTFALSSGESRALTVKLNSTGLGLLNSVYRLPTELMISGTTTLTQPVTFAYPQVRSFVAWTWSYKGTHTYLEQLDVTQIPAGGDVTVLCQGDGCRSAHQSFAAKHGSSIGLASSITKNGTLTAGAKLQITISAPNSVAKVMTIAIRPNNYPSVVKACLLPGAAHPAACA